VPQGTNTIRLDRIMELLRWDHELSRRASEGSTPALLELIEERCCRRSTIGRPS
jgi:hypothetical protein